MHRDSVDDAVTYMPDDLVLFRESPFAAWMERLTLDNPEHGILPDGDAPAPREHLDNVDDIIATLRAEGRNVAVIDPAQTSFERREDTLSAMRSGADFIASGYLEQANIGANAGLLMRTSGFSSLGNFLYIPCEARPLDPRNSPFRLCVLAELLLAIQKQLPPQLLVISGDAELTPLQTEDHIYYYRAVRERFLDAMANFRKHKMPDPAESAYFGRWSECASEVLKQRAQREDEFEDEEPEVLEEIVVELPKMQAAGAGSAISPQAPQASLADQAAMLAKTDAPTLAEQASRLTPGTYDTGHAPGHTPNLARVAPLRAVAQEPEREPQPEVQPEAQLEAGSEPRSEPRSEPESMELDIVDDEPPVRRSSDVALQNLEFIGSGPASLLGPEPLVQVPPPGLERVAPRERLAEPQDSAAVPAAPETRESFAPESPWPEREPLTPGLRAPLPELEPRDPVLLPPEPAQPEAAAAHQAGTKRHPLDSVSGARDEFIDMDAAPPASLTPLPQEADPVDEESVLSAIERLRSSREQEALRNRRHISDSLITGEEFEDRDEP
ncbi:MAG: hypothetical protein HKN19_16650 [Halioglobus sp.]|nr:hypothetical protein [Halioglobus sp.]